MSVFFGGCGLRGNCIICFAYTFPPQYLLIKQTGMLKRVVVFILISVLILVSILLINTFRSKPWPVFHESIVLEPFPDSALIHMSGAIQIPTISISDTASIDTVSFKRFGEYIASSYPRIHANLVKTMVKDFSFIFEWKGKNSSLDPIVLMSHYDVVPVEPAALSNWSAPPFSGLITDTCIWGRGSCDDKFGVISILEAVEDLLKKGFTPDRTIFLCFGHDEEVRGTGAKSIVDWFEQKKIKPEMVLDEGGQVSVEKAAEIGRPLAVIGVAEKGYASFELSVDKPGGHSSVPENETAIDILAKSLVQLRTHLPPPKLTPQLREFLGRIGSSSHKFQNRMASANMWLFSGLTKKLLATEPEGEAMMHTTMVPTIINAGVKDNVVPGFATAVVNTRILSGETISSVEDYIRKTIKDVRVSVKRIGELSTDPSKATLSSSPAFKRVESAVYQTVPTIIPTPYEMVGATDSRFFRKISDRVVNFFPMTDAKGYHGVNERIMLIDLQRGIHYIKLIIRESGKSF